MTALAVAVLAVLGASTGFLPAALLAARDVVGLRGMDRYHAAAATVLTSTGAPFSSTIDSPV